jgi:hypothetical protein
MDVKPTYQPSSPGMTLSNILHDMTYINYIPAPWLHRPIRTSTLFMINGRDFLLFIIYAQLFSISARKSISTSSRHFNIRELCIFFHRLAWFLPKFLVSLLCYVLITWPNPHLSISGFSVFSFIFWLASSSNSWPFFFVMFLSHYPIFTFNICYQNRIIPSVLCYL